MYPPDDDCEDQALVPTKTCVKWECQTGFANGGPIYPGLVKRDRYWCCPSCGSSYGEHAHPDLR